LIVLAHPSSSVSLGFFFTYQIPCLFWRTKQEEFYIEPDAGQTTYLDIDDRGDIAYRAYKTRDTTFINDMLVQVVEYTRLESLGYHQGNRARVAILRV